jgi:NADH-quinone oxidoreductase subunit J
MTALCYSACAIALVAAAMVVVSHHAMHALLNLIVMLLALALAFSALGAPFAAALQVMIYAGAIMVLFVFVVMMLNLGPDDVRREGRWTGLRMWVAPVLLTAALLALSLFALTRVWGQGPRAGVVGPKEVGIALFRPYLLAVEIVSLVLVAGLAAAFHFAPPPRTRQKEEGADA